MRSTLLPIVAGVLMVAFVSSLGLGMLAPPRAHADDTGKVLLGVAAGVLLFGLLDRDKDRRCDDYAYRQTDPRCYQYQGHWYWRDNVDRRPERTWNHRGWEPDRNVDDRYPVYNRGQGRGWGYGNAPGREKPGEQGRDHGGGGRH